MINIFTKRSLLLVAVFVAALSIAQLNPIAQITPNNFPLSQNPTELCSNLTPETRLLADQSGFDIDAFCLSQSMVVTPTIPVEEGALIPMRNQETPQIMFSPEEESDELQPYGYDLFSGSPTTFAPDIGIPVSPDYLLGPGDTLQILFYGKTNISSNLEINRDGFINLPELGPIVLAGLTFGEAKKMLLKRISEQMIGVQASISLGQLRSIQIFILGETFKPGAYTVSSLSTITNALIVSGGVNKIASLRNIQLKRAGKIIATLDLYDLLLRGDISGDLRLQANDVIFIPPVGDLASVDGEVLRPAIYELKGNTSVQQLIELTGGLSSKAYTRTIRIERVNEEGFMTVIDLDLNTNQGQNFAVTNGDYLYIDPVVDRKENIVTLSGHVYRPGDFRWKKGMRISDIISEANQLPDNVDLDFALIRRELPPIGKVQAMSVDLREVFANKESKANLELFPRDMLMVFSTHDLYDLYDLELSTNENDDDDEKSIEQLLREGDRPTMMLDIVDQLKAQARSGKLAKVVSIIGTARFPGEYPLTEGMTIATLIKAAGGLIEESYTQQVEISRLDLSDPESAKYNHQALSLNDALSTPSSDIELHPRDIITLRVIPDFRENTTITLNGEVTFPGQYNFLRGETLSQVINRAGGLTDLANIKAAVYTREELKLREELRIQKLQQELEQSISLEALEKANEGKASQAALAENLLIDNIENIEATGRLVINLEKILDGSIDDLNLKDGDTLYIPEFNQEVSVIGEVQYPTSHLYEKTLSVEDYLKRSGGITRAADKNRIYIVKADGSVYVPREDGFFRSARISSIEAGDTVVVPVDVTQMNPLTTWSEATQVIYQLAVATAAVNSF